MAALLNTQCSKVVQCKTPPAALQARWRHQRPCRKQTIESAGRDMGTSSAALRRHSQVGASTSYAPEPAVDEQQFYRQLADTALRGDYFASEKVVLDMRDAGLELTPQAFHGLIFSATKAGELIVALEALQLAEKLGVQPVVETYAALIYACILAADFAALDEVYGSMQQWDYDKQPAWHSTLQGLIDRWRMDESLEEKDLFIKEMNDHLAEGREVGFYPDADQYEFILTMYCEDPQMAMAAEDMIWEEIVVREGIEPETRHYNCILRAEAIFQGVFNARKTLDEMMEGRLGKKIVPNIESYNALLEGCLVERNQGFSYALEDLEGVVAEIVRVGLKMNKRTHSLLMLHYFQDSNTDLVLFHLREMEKLAAPGRALELISDEWVVRLLTFLLRQKCVIEVARLLYVLLSDDRGLPPEAGLLDGEGLSLHTRWLSAFYAGQHFGRRTEGLEKLQDPAEEEEGFVVNDDTLLNRDNVAVNWETKTEISPSSMTTAQMKAELESKGLPTDGVKRELTRRIQGSRGTAPRSVREVVLARTADKQAKSAREVQRQKERTVVIGLERWLQVTQFTQHGRLVKETRSTVLVDPEEDEKKEEARAFASLNQYDFPDDVKALVKMSRIAANMKDEEGLELIDAMLMDTDSPGFRALNPNFGGRPGYGMRLEWPRWGWGSYLAWVMMNLAESLGCGISLGDLRAIHEGALEELDVETACAVLGKLHSFIEDVDPEVLALFHTKTLLLCMNEQRAELVVAVIDAMQQLQLEPAGVLEGTLPQIREVASAQLQRLEEAAVQGSPPSEGEDGVSNAGRRAQEDGLDQDEEGVGVLEQGEEGSATAFEESDSYEEEDLE